MVAAAGRKEIFSATVFVAASASTVTGSRTARVSPEPPTSAMIVEEVSENVTDARSRRRTVIDPSVAPEGAL